MLVAKHATEKNKVRVTLSNKKAQKKALCIVEQTSDTATIPRHNLVISLFHCLVIILQISLMSKLQYISGYSTLSHSNYPDKY